MRFSEGRATLCRLARTAFLTHRSNNLVNEPLSIGQVLPQEMLGLTSVMLLESTRNSAMALNDTGHISIRGVRDAQDRLDAWGQRLPCVKYGPIA